MNRTKTRTSTQNQTALVKPSNKLFLLLTLFAFFGLAMQVYSQPATSASTPGLPQGKVISLWNSSGTYTNVPVNNYFEVWYAADPYFYGMPDTGSNVLLYASMSCCAAIELDTNTINVSGCTNLHVDVFTPTGNNLSVRLVDTLGHSADAYYSVASGVITNNGWIGLDMPLAQFKSANPSLNLNFIKQIGWIDNNAGSSTPADYYVDNVYFNAGTNLVYTPPPAIPTPTNNAPTPTNAAASVLSMYNSSGTYTDHTGINWDASWSGSPESDFVITNLPGSTVKYMPGLSYVGVEFYDPNQIDATGFTGLHFDVWTLDANQIGVQLVSLTPTAAAQVYTSISTTQKWVSVNIPLSQFTTANPATVLSHLQQLLWVDNGGSGIQNGTFYIDNVYFYSNGVPVTPAVTNSLVANGNFETNAATSTGLASWEQAGSGGAIGNPVTINTTDPYAGLQAISIEGQGTGGVGAGPTFYQNSIPVVPGTLTMSFYAKAAVQLGGANPQYQISWRNAADAQIGVSGFSSWPTALNTNTYTLETISSLTAPAGSDHCTITMLLAVGAGTGDHYKVLVDNLSLVQNSITSPSTVINYPTNNAPTPTHSSGSVLSMYNSSGTYSDHSGISWYAGWSVVSSMGNYTITNTGAVVKKYLGLSYSGVEFYNPNQINATPYDTLHMDVWTTANQLAIKLVSTDNGAAPEYIIPASSGTITSNHWVSLNIPLSAFTSLAPTLDLTHLDQMLFVDNGDISGSGVQLGDFYIDNVYFYSSVVTPNSPTITAPAVSGGNFTLQVSSQTGYNYILQATPSLAPTSWTGIKTNAGTGGVLNFSVPVSGNPQQFYRVKVQ